MHDLDLGSSFLAAPPSKLRKRRVEGTLRRLAMPLLASVVVLSLLGCAGWGGSSNRWVGTWAAAPTGPADLGAAAPFVSQITLDKVTLRMVVRSSISGSKLRVRFSNEIGDAPAPVHIGAAHVALRDKGSAILPGTDRVLTFGGQQAVTIAPKGQVVSDSVELDVPALADLAVSIYLPERTLAQSGHYITRQAQYVVTGSDASSALVLPASATPAGTWLLLSGIDVAPRNPNAAAMVILGDSITDGFGEQAMRVDAPAPWPAWPSRLAERLQAQPSLGGLAVLNAGISGNRVLNDGAQSVPPSAGGLRSLAIFGPKALSRFERDVADQSGASCALIFEGINDIGQGPAREQVVSAEQLIAGHRQLIAKARGAGLRVLGATLTPFQGYAAPTYYSPENEAKRQAVNTWIRNGGEYDAIIDFDALLRDPANPARLQAQYDSGDHLHPSDVGYKAMAEGVPLGLIERHCLQKP